ncbi:unnamed protein product [Euphydryas editha]|uniref:Uncharacterized protein n=1 Tax=Euphydryas editha TaxID=104508 RepID=A0AAU9VAC1_EUPED|nr:unnamed protein product [Euphydryas editha]
MPLIAKSPRFSPSESLQRCEFYCSRRPVNNACRAALKSWHSSFGSYRCFRSPPPPTAACIAAAARRSVQPAPQDALAEAPWHVL